uniref:Uncharacterized protein n=1 Tax=Vitis vinifera TaxID=29760 RepID=A5AHP4_VITVI|nr:hypothetical protein VITISV_021051 [Vitis vinifera]
MKNQALELHIPLPKSFKVCKERSKEKRKNRVKENRGKLAAVFFCTFGALPEVHFLHYIYHFKAQEVKNPMLQTVRDLELKRRSYSHCKQITPKCCEISLLLREFRSLFVQCYGIPPEATRYMPQAGTLRTSRWKPISQPCEFNLLLRKYFAALLSVCEISQTPFSSAKCQPNSEDFSTEDERLSFLSLGGRIKWRRCRGSNLESNGAIATAAARDESNGAVAGDRTSNQMVPLPLPLLGTNQMAPLPGIKPRIKWCHCHCRC